MRSRPQFYETPAPTAPVKYTAPPGPDLSEYPTRWAGYIGQEPATKMLKVAAASARMRNEPLDHILITHPSPGIGKTALANLVGRELRRPVVMVSGKVTAAQARFTLSKMKDRDVLFYDEIHRVAEGGQGSGEWLLHLLQDYILLGPLGAEPQPKITVIGATTKPARLPEAVLDRFMVPPMQNYSVEEAARIAQVMAPRFLTSEMPKLSRAEASLLALAAGNNPRSIKKLLKSLRDLTITNALPLVKGHFDVHGMLAFQGITPDGLDRDAQRYLTALGSDFDGSAGIKALEERLRQVGGLVDTERMLMDRGLVARTRTGRALTQAGLARYNDLVAS